MTRSANQARLWLDGRPRTARGTARFWLDGRPVAEGPPPPPPAAVVPAYATPTGTNVFTPAFGSLPGRRRTLADATLLRDDEELMVIL